MNIQQLEYLIAVDRYKHFGKAAQACFITQPTLSAMIQKLEEELDVKIFDRTTHPIRTTDSGLEIIMEAQKVVDSVNELRNKASLLNNVLAGNVNLGIIPTVSAYLLPTHIFDFLTEHPKINFNIKEMTTDNIIRSLKSGELDAGIIATPYSTAEEFYHDFLFNEELMLYSNNFGTDEKTSTYVVPEELDAHKVWLLEEGNCLRKQFENICQLKENQLKPQNLDFQAANISTLVQMVDRIGGATIIPELAAEHFPQEQKGNVKRFRKPFPHREISLIYYKPTYKQKILDEMILSVKKSLESKLNYYQNPEEFINILPQ